MSLLVPKEFEQLFQGQRYNHRVSTHGDRVARMLYEDLYTLNLSPIFKQRVDERACVANTLNIVTGQKSRRGDGLFGEALPGSKPEGQPDRNVAVGPTANVQIGAEVKILAKSMIKQIDRVINDLRHQASVFSKANQAAITIGIVGVNHATSYTSYEGNRAYTAEGNKAPSREAPRIIERLKHEAAPSFDEFIVLPFQATNTEPYSFSWVNSSRMEQELNAALLRTIRLYEKRF